MGYNGVDVRWKASAISGGSMDTVNILPGGSIGNDFASLEDRNQQSGWAKEKARALRSEEIEALKAGGNRSGDWGKVLVSGEFDTSLVRNCEFSGLVRLGNIRNVVLEHDGVKVAAGITSSRIISCDIGDDCAIHDVHQMANYIVGSRCIVTSVDEMLTDEMAVFGNGIIKSGQDEGSRAWIDVANESGGRQILGFEGMLAADAYLWAKYREDEALQQMLVQVTQKSFDSRPGQYGRIGEQSIISSVKVVRNAMVGPHCRIKGADRLENVSIDSSEDEPTAIGSGVELADGIVGRGCSVMTGSLASRFVMADHSNLKNGARLTNTYLGDNSTVACCEVSNNLIFAGHEQHHNNSFLIASMVMGQSNIAAGATIGSNHNSRAADGEIRAGRGFWPGLCTSLKHPSRFASFCLIAKGDYAHELNISLPFALVNNNAAKDQLEVMPAYWWMYNMYALMRNSAKCVQRDSRRRKLQHIEFDFLAPDTAEEVIRGMRHLMVWAAKASLRKKKTAAKLSDADLCRMGREVFSSEEAKSLEVLGDNVEKSKRKVAIIKAHEAYHAYERMLLYYSVKTLIGYSGPFAEMKEKLKDGQREWVNLGGQLVGADDIEELRTAIVAGRIATWTDIHARYDGLWKDYPLQKQKHAWAVFSMLMGTQPTKETWAEAIDKAVSIQEEICRGVKVTREKDYDDPFRTITCRNRHELAAAMGTIEGNSFVKQVEEETAKFRQSAEEAKKRA
jgi:hypothetical protein